MRDEGDDRSGALPMARQGITVMAWLYCRVMPGTVGRFRWAC